MQDAHHKLIFCFQESLDMLTLNHVGYSYLSCFNGDFGYIRELMETNFLSCIAITISALPMLKESKGSIIIISSMEETAMKTISHVIHGTAASEECVLEIIKSRPLHQKELYYLYLTMKSLLFFQDWAPDFLNFLIKVKKYQKNIAKEHNGAS
ncbi:11-beta-hydroxysteroid dehydrogenase 1-like [Rhea pennata]|uniref:11-beta-hydroxysteroid dehydrogenase 1-like n=1 Tax=Rhea pennata TaxID=8795 RepID=UPI002E2560E2